MKAFYRTIIALSVFLAVLFFAAGPVAGLHYYPYGEKTIGSEEEVTDENETPIEDTTEPGEVETETGEGETETEEGETGLGEVETEQRG